MERKPTPIQWARGIGRTMRIPLLSMALWTPIILATGACAQRQSQADQETGQPVTSFVADFGEDGMSVWKDPATGCEYIVYASYKKGGITPRMDGRDGGIQRGCSA